MKALTVVIVAPGAKPKVLEVDGKQTTLAALQALVGGYIERVPTEMLEPALDCWVNEEGLLDGLPPNLVSPDGHHLVGTIVFTRHGHAGDTLSTEPGDLMVIDAWLQASKRVRFQGVI